MVIGVVIASTEFVYPNSNMGKPQSPKRILEKRNVMNELLFFVLGLMIGGLIGVTVMCILQINRLHDKYICEEEQ